MSITSRVPSLLASEQYKLSDVHKSFNMASTAKTIIVTSKLSYDDESHSVASAWPAAKMGEITRGGAVGRRA